MVNNIESENAPVPAPPAPSTENPETPSATEIVTDADQSVVPESEFNRAAVEELGNRVRVTDTDTASGLELFCYAKCGPDDGELLRQCRGVVFSGEEIVMRAFPYTIEYSHQDADSIATSIPSFEGCSFYEAHEGALVRVFSFEGRWYVSTHRKLNAFRSKWASKESFGTTFKRALEEEAQTNENFAQLLPEEGESVLDRFYKILDPTKQYMFLVRHTEENRIVCSPPVKPTVFHVGTFVGGELVMTEDISIPYPKKLEFASVDDLTQYVEQIDIRHLQGVIAFVPGNIQYKILHKEYQALFRARGNEPSIKFRYLQVRMSCQMVDMLYHLYPSMASVFDEYENTLYGIAKVIYRSYVQRHIKGKWSTLPNEEYRVDKECHTWHEEDRKTNRVTVEKIIEILNNQTATNLNKMIRRFHADTEKQQETQTTNQTRARSNTMTSLSPAMNAQAVASPLLLSKNRARNPNLPPSLDLGGVAADLLPGAVETCQDRENF
jgi:hypothetical protein